MIQTWDSVAHVGSVYPLHHTFNGHLFSQLKLALTHTHSTRTAWKGALPPDPLSPFLQKRGECKFSLGRRDQTSESDPPAVAPVANFKFYSSNAVSKFPVLLEASKLPYLRVSSSQRPLVQAGKIYSQVQPVPGTLQEGYLRKIQDVSNQVRGRTRMPGSSKHSNTHAGLRGEFGGGVLEGSSTNCNGV